MTTILPLYSSSVSSVTISSTASCMYERPSGSYSRYASSMNSTAPRAESKMSLVLAPVCPTKPVLKSEADTCTTSADGSTPNASKSMPNRRATVVLPVPGEPWKQKVSARSSTGFRPALLAASMTAWYSNSRVLMFSHPIKPSKTSEGSSMYGSSTTKSSSKSSFLAARSAGGRPSNLASARTTAPLTALSTAPALPKLGRIRALARSLRTACLAVSNETLLPRRCTLRSKIRSSA
mmetsp:Transcript_24127/g.43028  ORF Transcript_24127/g.43028 Transcript_24127/m.43028 type:complete len:236 (+) Transcript_24127:130-837(+)